MNFASELETLTPARYPIRYLVSSEELRVQALVLDIAQKRAKKVFEWSCSTGIVPAGTSIQSQKLRNAATKDPVVALREIAAEAINKDDLREEYIHAMQKHVEVDEPEETEVPLIAQSGDMSVVDDQGQDQPEFEQMTEEELLRGLEGLPPAESPGSQRNGY